MKKLFSGIKWFEDTLTSAFLSIVVLITLTSLDKGTQPFVVCDG